MYVLKKIDLAVSANFILVTLVVCIFQPWLLRVVLSLYAQATLTTRKSLAPNIMLQTERPRQTLRSATRTHVETNLSLRREITPALSRIVSRRVRAEPQQDWSSRAPHSTTECTSFFSVEARSKASVKL